MIGTNYVTDFGGNVVKESDLGDCNFGLNVIGNPEGITIDYPANTFTVAEGGTATFYLQANTGFGQPQVLEIKREGDRLRARYDGSVTVFFSIYAMKAQACSLPV